MLEVAATQGRSAAPGRLPPPDSVQICLGTEPPGLAAGPARISRRDSATLWLPAPPARLGYVACQAASAAPPARLGRGGVRLRPLMFLVPPEDVVSAHPLNCFHELRRGPPAGTPLRLEP